MATIEKRTQRTKPYRVRYRGADGKEYSQSFRLKEQARAFANTTETEILNRAWVSPERAKTRYREWAELWLEGLDIKDKTHADYRGLLDIHVLPRFGDLPLRGIEPTAVRAWLADLEKTGLSGSRRRRAFHVLSASLKQATTDRYLAVSPCVGIKRPVDGKRTAVFLSAEQLHDLAEATPEPYQALIYTLGYCAPRWGEAVGVRRSRIDLMRRRLSIVETVIELGKQGVRFGVPKNGEPREVAIPGFLADLLTEHLAHHVDDDPSALVFTHPNGGILPNSWFRRNVFLPACKASGMPKGLRIHDLRHTAASIMISTGGSPKAIQDVMGHKTINLTFSLYGHLFDTDRDELAKRLDSVARVAQMRPKDRDNVRALART